MAIWLIKIRSDQLPHAQMRRDLTRRLSMMKLTHLHTDKAHVSVQDHNVLGLSSHITLQRCRAGYDKHEIKCNLMSV